MHWNQLESIQQLDDIAAASGSQPQLIFKHSTRCGISSGAKQRLEGSLEQLAGHFQLHFLDLLAHRDISNEIAEKFSVKHESPQIIVLRDGQAIFDLSHYSIQPDRIIELVSG